MSWYRLSPETACLLQAATIAEPKTGEELRFGRRVLFVGLGGLVFILEFEGLGLRFLGLGLGALVTSTLDQQGA